MSNETEKDRREKLLNRIAHYLILHSSFTNNLGLLNGKMGIAIFFYHYAKYTKKKLYTKFADDLIDEIYKNIRPNYPFNYVDGLCGIAWGIEYLVRNKFVAADTDDVLIDIDNLILERDVRRMNDISMETGLKGIAYYVLSRCQNESSMFGIVNRMFIVELIQILRKHVEESDVFQIVSQLDRYIVSGVLPDSNYILRRIIDADVDNEDQNIFDPPCPLGIIHSGMTGIGLRMINV